MKKSICLLIGLTLLLSSCARMVPGLRESVGVTWSRTIFPLSKSMI